MNDWLTVFFGGTGFTGLVAILYTIFKERKKNNQEDLKGDLTLGELFRASARKEVELVYQDMARLHGELEAQKSICNHHTQQLIDQQQQIETQAITIALVQARYRAAEEYVTALLKEWGKPVPPSPPRDYKLGESKNDR